MARPKKTESNETNPEAPKFTQLKHSVSEITENFSNGEVNQLKEKLNELIRATK